MTMPSYQPDAQQAPEPPRGHVRMVYLGPVAPHWEVESEFGERSLIEEFRQRALARLWVDAASLPTPPEVDAPGLWLARLEIA